MSLIADDLMKKILLLFTAALFLCMQPGSDAVARDISELSDKEVRALLIEKLEEPEVAPEPVFNPAAVAYKFQFAFTKVRQRASTLLGAYDQLPGLPAEWWKRVNHGRDGKAFGAFLITFLICIAAGLMGSALVKRRLDRFASAETKELSLAARFAGRLFRHVVGVVALITIATIGYFILASDDQRDRTLFFFYLSAVAIIALVAGGSRALFEPDAPDLRIPSMSDSDARSFHRSIMLSTAFGAFGFFSCASFGSLGIGGDVHDLLLLSVGAGTTFLLSYTIWCQRHAISGDILAGSPEPSLVRQFVSEFWPIVSFLAVPLLFFGLLVNIFLGGLALYGAALFTVIILILVPITEAALSRAIVKLEGTEHTLSTIVARVSRIALLLLVALLLAVVWRINLIATDDSTETRVFQTLIQITATVAVGYAVWQVLRVFLDQKIAEEDAAFGLTDADLNPEEIGTGMSRTRTLLPLLRRAALIVIFTVVTLVSLSAMGVDTAPLLAGAGVVGLAIGFGSQTLVKDVVSGFFFLLEDAFRLGEYIDVGKVKGTVETISVRSLKLRHHRGALNTVPFGSVAVIENFSRDWSIMKLKVRVPFETDLNKVRKLLKEVGKELGEVEAIKDDFLQPFKAQGAVEVDDYGFVISTKFMSKPGKQFTIRRFAFQAMQDAFEKHNIPFSRPRVRVVVDEESNGSKAEQAAAAAATALKSSEA